MKISDKIFYVGVNDHEIDLFEGQYKVPDGMAYNSYVIIDEKVAVLDTVDADFCEDWLTNISNLLGDREPDYLIIQHMEPDHSGSIIPFLNKYKNTVVVSSSKAFTMMNNFFGNQFEAEKIEVTDGSILEFGNTSLSFVTAPMVHWPEVIMTYEKNEKVLFSADAFGKFGALDVEQDWACEARRYYFGIVGKYGMQVRNLFAKVGTLDIKTICPLHGPILDKDLGYYLNLYKIWSGYEVESEGIVIAYTSVYGNTEKAVNLLANELLELGAKKVVVNDLARCDMAEAVEDAFRYGTIVFATTTYNGEIFPFMREFINHLKERNFQNRKIAFIENGSWAPVATKVMKDMMANLKNLTEVGPVIKIMSSVSEQNISDIKVLAKELIK